MLTSVRYLVVDSHLLMQIFQGRYIPDLYDLYDLYDMYDLAHVAGWEPYNLRYLAHVLLGFDLYCTDPAQLLRTAG